MCEKTGKASKRIPQAKLNSENLIPKSFVCIHCEEKHFSEELLIQHILIHHSKPYHCFFCPFKSQKLSCLLQHVKKFANHCENICTVCSFESKSIVELNMHLLLHNSPLPFFCNSCELQFKCRSLWSKHLLGHSQKTEFSCSQCLEKFNTISLQRMHEMKSHTKKKNKCDECGYSTRFPAYLKKHISRHEGKFLHCTVFDCNFKTLNKESLKLHEMGHEKSENIVCPDCGIVFKYERNLKRHTDLYHSSQCTFKCTECNYQSGRRDKLNEHLIRVHNAGESVKACKDVLNGNVREYNKCNVCEYVTKFPSYLKRHALKHGKSLLHCASKDCCYTTRHPSYMKRHFRRHKEKCLPSSNKIPESSRVNGKKLLCPECGVAFNHQKNLNRHKELHGSKFVFSCSRCPYQSARRDKVKAHCNRHHANLVQVNIIKNLTSEVEHEGLDSCDARLNAVCLHNKDKTGNTSSPVISGKPFALLMPLKHLETHLDESTGILSFICDIPRAGTSLYASQQSQSKGSDNSGELALAYEDIVSKEKSSVDEGRVSDVSMLNMNESPCLETLLDEVTGEITTLQGNPTHNSADSIDNLSDTMDFTYDIDFMNDDSFDGFDEFDDFIFESISNVGNCGSFMEKILNEETGELCLEVQSESSSSEIKPYWQNADQEFHSARETVLSELFLDEVTGEFSFQS